MSNITRKIAKNQLKDLYIQQCKEIERLKEENFLLRASEPMSKLQEDYGYKAEVERLNNVINELENKLKYEIHKSGFEQDYHIKLCYEDILDELEELKGVDKE